jgi:hypothetical protein
MGNIIEGAICGIMAIIVHMAIAGGLVWCFGWVVGLATYGGMWVVGLGGLYLVAREMQKEWDDSNCTDKGRKENIMNTKQTPKPIPPAPHAGELLLAALDANGEGR